MVRRMTRLARPSARALLTRVLDTPNLVPALRALPPPAFAAIVSGVGLEDAGELVAIATPEQLTHLFDEDAFDRNEEIDPDRFAIWLEALLESGDAFAADRIVRLPDDAVYAAIDTFVLVLDLDPLDSAIHGGASDLSEASELLDSSRTEELGGHLLVAKRHDGWDAMWTLLLALDRDHEEYLERILRRLCHAAMEDVRELGFSEVLRSAQMIVEDAASEREERRARSGYVSTSDARAFLALARSGGDADVRDAITTAWFRRLSRQPAAPGSGSDLERVLAEAGAIDGAPLLPSGTGGADPASRLRAAMEALAESAPAIHAARLDELAFLANVLAADAKLDERRRRAIEAVEDVVATCGRAVAARSSDPAHDVDVLRARSLDLLFRDAVRNEPASAPAAKTGKRR
jgi:hypothetical protein